MFLEQFSFFKIKRHQSYTRREVITESLTENVFSLHRTCLFFKTNNIEMKKVEQEHTMDLKQALAE